MQLVLMKLVIIISECVSMVLQGETAVRIYDNNSTNNATCVDEIGGFLYWVVLSITVIM